MGSALGDPYKEQKMIEVYDSREGYCRKLGHYVEFKYCRGANNNIPCYKIMDCWFERLPIENFMQQHYSASSINKIFTPPAPKIASILDIIDRVKRSMA